MAGLPEIAAELRLDNDAIRSYGAPEPDRVAVRGDHPSQKICFEVDRLDEGGDSAHLFDLGSEINSAATARDGRRITAERA